MYICHSVVLIIINLIYKTYSCNDNICGSIISKCQITGDCQCDMSVNKNICKCCNRCHICLDKLYSECCSCIGLCPEKNLNSIPLTYTSTVEDFQINGEFQDLFIMLVDNSEGRWNSFNYPAFIDLQNNNKLIENIAENRCRIAFIDECQSLETCRDYCTSMGSSKMRWFHLNGCCQCVGRDCVTYGKLKPLCVKCRNRNSEL